MVPITDTFMAIDYAVSRNLPVALVTNSRLGSINHTILSLEALRNPGAKLHSVLYNTWYDKDSAPIAADTQAFIRRYIERNHPGTPFYVVPVYEP